MFDHLDTISRLSSIYIHIGPDLIRYTLTTIYYSSCQKISGCYHIRVQSYSQRIYMQQSNWVIYHFGHYFQISSIYIHIGPDLIRYTLTTINYPSCQQISVIYNIRVQNYLQRIYLQQSNWVIFDHFGHYFHINCNLYSFCTKFNSIHINYNKLFILSTNFRLLSHTSAKLFTKNLYAAIKLGHLPFWTLFADYLQFIFILHQI